MKNKNFPGLVATLFLCGAAAVIVSACGGDDIVGSSDPDSVADARAAALVAQMTRREDSTGARHGRSICELWRAVSARD